MTDKADFSKLLQVIISIQDDRTFQDVQMRFWLPPDRPVEDVIRAIVSASEQAESSPFRVALSPSVTFSLWRGESGLNPAQNLREQRVDSGSALRLLPARGTVKSFMFNFNNREALIIQQGMVIGVADAGYKPDIDLTPYISAELVGKVARRHAQVRLLNNGELALQILGETGITVLGDKPYLPGSAIVLKHGAMLAVQNANIEVSAWQAD